MSVFLYHLLNREPGNPFICFTHWSTLQTGNYDEIIDFRDDSTCVLEAKPGKLDIKRREPGILFISLPFGSLFKMAVSRE